MKRFATLTMVSTLAALEIFLSVVFLGGCATPDRSTAPQSAIVVSSNSQGVSKYRWPGPWRRARHEGVSVERGAS